MHGFNHFKVCTCELEVEVNTVTHHRFPIIVVHKINLHGVPGRGNNPITVQCVVHCLKPTGKCFMYICYNILLREMHSSITSQFSTLHWKIPSKMHLDASISESLCKDISASIQNKKHKYKSKYYKEMKFSFLQEFHYLQSFWRII